MFDLEIYKIVNVLALIIGIIFGFTAQQKQFCFSGAIKDYLQIKSTKRAASVVFAMIVAIVSTAFVSSFFDLDLQKSAYFRENTNYFAIILGGVLFGAGMMIADGCSSRSIVKFSQGDSNALITLIFIAIFAYATTRGLLYGVFNPFINNETLIKLSSKIANFQVNIYLVLAILFALLIFFTKKLKRIFTLFDGFIIGLLVSFAWFVTGHIGSQSFERSVNFASLSFVYPSAQTLEFFTSSELNTLNFGICLVVGTMLGVYISTFFNKKYSFGCTANKNLNKVKYNMIGGSMMGVGGVLALGCTVGQGLSGISTLAFSSFLAVLSIFISGYFTGKFLHKRNKLQMCFLFEWDDVEEKPINYQT